MSSSLRRMVIVRAPGTIDIPMLRISNSFLAGAGFEINTRIEVFYEKGRITITKLASEHHASHS